MSDKEKNERDVGLLFLFCIIVLAIVSVLSSCAPRIKYITQIQHDSVYVKQVETDIVYMKDSVYIDRIGDTIVKGEVRWAYRYITLHDTIAKIHTDSVPYPVEVVRYKTKKEPLKTTFAWLFVCTIIIICVRYVYKKILGR